MPSPSWITLASRPAVVTRGLWHAFIGGLLIGLIDHGPAILAGGLDAGRVLRMITAAFVVYLVSTAASVAAARQEEPAGRRPRTTSARPTRE